MLVGPWYSGPDEALVLIDQHLHRQARELGQACYAPSAPPGVRQDDASAFTFPFTSVPFVFSVFVLSLLVFASVSVDDVPSDAPLLFLLPSLAASVVPGLSSSSLSLLTDASIAGTESS